MSRNDCKPKEACLYAMRLEDENKNLIEQIKFLRRKLESMQNCHNCLMWTGSECASTADCRDFNLWVER